MAYLKLILAVMFFLFVGSCRKAGQWLVRDDHPGKADAIIILMGSISDRVLQAADLYKQGVSNKVIFVEPVSAASQALQNRGVKLVRTSDIVKDALIQLGVPSDSIIIFPGGANSTIMEAQIMLRYISGKPELDSLVLVSSSFHLLRASYIFRTVFKRAGHPIVIQSSPSAYSSFNAEKWYRSRESIKTVISEYLKLWSFFYLERWGIRSKPYIHPC